MARQERPFGGINILGLRTAERPHGVGAPTLPPPTREAPPPSRQTLAQTLEEAIIQDSRTAERPKKAKKNRRLIVGNAIAAGLAIAGAWGVKHYVFEDNTSSANSQTQSIDSFPNTFTDNRLVSREAINKDEIFDNTKTKGVKSERNTISMSPEEYQKIAPPVIDRQNRKEVLGEFALPSDTAEATGNKTRKLTLEQDTSVNALIYVKTADGKIRETTYTKVSNPGEVTGQYPLPVRFPGCGELLGQGEEIQAGDIFPAPISGDVYYTAPTYYDYYNGEKIEKGSFVYASYTIIGEYIDKEGNKFMVRVGINTLGASGSAITKPLVPNMSNASDLVKKVTIKRPSGIEEVVHQAPTENQIPKVRIEQGKDLFKFVTQPPFQRFSNASDMKAQLGVSLSYSYINANGVANSFGGENCVHPTVDNKAIVLIQ